MIDELNKLGSFDITVPCRHNSNNKRLYSQCNNVQLVECDLKNLEMLVKVIEPGSIVINLVYLWTAGTEENLTLINILLDACRQVKIKRFIQVSTAAVVGRVKNNIVTEDIKCNPLTEYGVTKDKIEEAVKDRGNGFFESIILRPTSVFGVGGEPLKKLAYELMNKSWLHNYFKSCLFNSRRMNLVCVENVIASMVFFIKHKNVFNGDRFIVSDDDFDINTYEKVEYFLMQKLGVNHYFLPRIKLPLFILSVLLKSLGRNNVNPDCTYSQDKLNALGFVRKTSLEYGLDLFAASCNRKKSDRTQ